MDYRIPPLSYAPDSLYESDIDALLAESGLDVEPDEAAEHEPAPVVQFRGDGRSTAVQSGGEVA